MPMQAAPRIKRASTVQYEHVAARQIVRDLLTANCGRLHPPAAIAQAGPSSELVTRTPREPVRAMSVGAPGLSSVSIYVPVPFILGVTIEGSDTVLPTSVAVIYPKGIVRCE